jgi:signal transduction histidine kinase
VDPDLVPKTSDLGITDPKRGGTGLGLHIVKTIAQTHDGRIEVKSSMGEGTTMSPYLALTN